jgi:hypothetical protein
MCYLIWIVLVVCQTGAGSYLPGFLQKATTFGDVNDRKPPL